MRRILLVLTVAVMMAAMMVATMAAAWAAPPIAGDNTGCEAGLRNAAFAIGTRDPSGDRQAPYRNNPGEGTGPDQGFDTAEFETSSNPNCLYI
jgi:predicted cobalt transporter CbtA